jgi:hypothetical protein
MLVVVGAAVVVVGAAVVVVGAAVVVVAGTEDASDEAPHPAMTAGRASAIRSAR